jgi:hypothetical protein
MVKVVKAMKRSIEEGVTILFSMRELVSGLTGVQVNMD